jgi:anaerobic selenocysteine-containing dehydrogenase
VAIRDAKKRGWKLIVVDPRRTELASFADVHLQVVPGEDAVLLAAMLKIILDESLFDRSFCDAWVVGVDQLQSALTDFSVDDAACRAGVPVGQIERAARLFAAGPRGTAVCGTGPNMSPFGTLVEHLTAAMNTICGRYVRAGERVDNPRGVMSARSANPVVRARPVGPNRDAIQRGLPARVRGLRGLPREALTNTLADEILLEGDGAVHALFVVGGRPMRAWPDQSKTARALRTLDLLVVVDVMENEATEAADFAIGSLLSLERADISALTDGSTEVAYTHYTPAVVQPLDDDLMTEARFFLRLAAALGLELRLPGGPVDASTAGLDEPQLQHRLLELIYPTPLVPWADVRATDGGAVHGHLGVIVEPADSSDVGRLDVAAPEMLGELDAALGRSSSRAWPDEIRTRFPLRLTVRRLRSFYNTSGLEIAGLRDRDPGFQAAFLHPEDLGGLEIEDGDPVVIASPWGEIEATARSASDVRVGTVSMAHGCADRFGRTTSGLVAVEVGYDPITGLPVQSAVPVRVTRRSPAIDTS